jgi:hypothetical protein
VKAFSEDDPFPGFDVHEADDALEPILVGDQVQVVQFLVGGQVVRL